MSEIPSLKQFRDLVSDLVACALIEGARPDSMTATVETKAAKQRVLDAFDEGLRSGHETSPKFPPDGPWPARLGDQCPQYWGRHERRCQLPQGHEPPCYFCVPSYAIRTDISLDASGQKAKPDALPGGDK